MSLLNGPVMRLSWQQAMRTRKFHIALILSIIPVLLGIMMLVMDLVNRKASPSVFDYQPGVRELADFVILGGTVPAVALLLASGIIADEVEDRTLSYLLVRPVARRTLYISKLLPVALLAAILGAIQVFGYGLLRLVSMWIVGAGAPTTYYLDGAFYQIADWTLIAAHIPVGMMAAALAALAFTGLFAFVSLLTTRYHFIVNLLVMFVVELPFGNLGGAGLGILTVTYHVRSLTEGLDPAHHQLVANAAPWPIALVALLALAAIWWWAGTARMARRDFNITSAAS